MWGRAMKTVASEDAELGSQPAFSSRRATKHAVAVQSTSTEDADEEVDITSTPTNETLVTDEFEWVRASPILTQLFQDRELTSTSTLDEYDDDSAHSRNNTQNSHIFYPLDTSSRTMDLRGSSHAVSPDCCQLCCHGIESFPCHEEIDGVCEACHCMMIPPHHPVSPTRGLHYQTFPCNRHAKNKDRWLRRSYIPDHYTNGGHHRCPNLSFECFYWRNLSKSNGTLPETEELHEKIRRLEGDKQTLSLQVSVLNEQIEAQNEKIRELESLLHKLRDRADRAEGMLQRDVLIRSSLENQKLDLMSELSSIKSRLSASEKDKFRLEDCLHKSESEAASLRRQLADKDETLNSLRNHQGKLSTPPETSPVTTESSLRRLQRRNHEMEKLKKALESVMSANEEKDRKIEELRAAMERYKRLQEKINNIHGGKQEEDNIDGSLLGLSPNSLQFNNFEKGLAEKPPVVPRPSATSTPYHGKTESSAAPRSTSSGQASPAPSSIHGSISSTPHKVGDYPPTVTSSEESINRPPKSESSCTLPADTNRSRPKTPFGKGFLKLKTGKRSTSAPDLAQSESVPVIGSQSGTLPVGSTAPGLAADGKHKNRGIRKIFGRLKRSNSQSLESDLPPEEFKRGGMRATAGARLGWSKELRGDKEKCTGSIESIGGIDVPFARWNGEKVAAWLHDMGLSTYIGDCKRWVANGDQLLKASSHDLEKELGIKNPLHRKKLQLALQAIGSDGQEEFGGLDHHWVTRWLDDVGLPQYKDVFSEARIDGRMLHYLTVEDLTNLKVTNLLHVVSLKRGIHVLRLNGFNPNCLKRRPAPNENNPPLPSEVALWTNHRVMEWLRSVDLSEYAPNLRGSGVHGALMVYETKFNAELLATLLSIPPNKTLLRRHLNTHFKQLVGGEIIQQKREMEGDSSFSPLTPNSKLKVSKKNQFSLMRKRSKSEMDLDDFVCPMDIQGPSRTQLGSRSLSTGQLREPSPYENATGPVEQEVRPHSGMAGK